MKLNLIGLLIFMATTFKTQAQDNDRVITVNNDTIPCKIGGPNVLNNFRYKTTDSGKTIRIKKEEIKEFYSADKKTWFRKIFYGNDRAIFMKVLERGKISLYETFSTVNNVTSYFLYATKNSDTSVFINTDRFSIISNNGKGRKALADLFADDKSVYDKYTARDHSEMDIRTLILYYNSDAEISPKK